MELLVRSQLLLAKELAEYMGIKIIGHNKYVRKEAGTIYTIQKVFEGKSMKWQFSIGSYRIDLYFPEHKLAIECDDRDRKDRDINYEIRRQKFIEDQLNYKFIRYNPDAKDFMIESVLNKIFQYIYKKRSSEHFRHNFVSRNKLEIKMSSVMPFSFNAFELCVVTISEKLWTRA